MSEERVFKHRRGLAIVIPAEIAERYHLAAGVKVEVVPVEEGIFLEPKDVPPWFSIGWERALDEVLARYPRAFELMAEPPEGEAPADAPDDGPPPGASAPQS